MLDTTGKNYLYGEIPKQEESVDPVTEFSSETPIYGELLDKAQWVKGQGDPPSQAFLYGEICARAEKIYYIGASTASTNTNINGNVISVDVRPDYIYSEVQKDLSDINIDEKVAEKVDEKIAELNYNDQAQSGQFVTSVQQANGQISVTRSSVQEQDIDGLSESLSDLDTAISTEEQRATQRESELSQSISEKYTKPSSGIPASDLASGVIPSASDLNAVQYVSQSLTSEQQAQVRTNIGAGTSSFSGSYNDLSNKPTIPSKTSELINDSNYITASGAPVQSVNGQTGDVTIPTPTAADLNAVQYVSQTLTDSQKTQARTNIGAGTSSFSGSYTDLTNKPTIPTTTEELINDSGFITADSPALTGTPTAPTPAVDNNSTRIATTKFVKNAIPTNVSAFTNDAGYIISSDIPVTSVNTQVGEVVLDADDIAYDTNYTVKQKIEDIVTTGGEPNVIEVVKQNGTPLTVTNKAVDVIVPTKTSDLTNNSGFITSGEAPVQSVNSKTGSVTLTSADIGSIANPNEKISGQYLKYNGTSWIADNAPSAPVTSVNSKTGAVTLSASDVGALADSTDVTKWNGVTLNKQTSAPTWNTYIPFVGSTSNNSAYYHTASITPGANILPKYDSNSYLYSTTPTFGDNSTKVATTAYVDTNTIADPPTKSTGQFLKYNGNSWVADSVPDERITVTVTIGDASISCDTTKADLVSYINNDIPLNVVVLYSATGARIAGVEYMKTYNDNILFSYTSDATIYELLYTNNGITSSYRTIPTTASDVDAIADPSTKSDGQFLKYNGTNWVADNIPGGASPSDSSPSMDGTAAAGTSSAYSRGDHVHPTDTSRQATITASGLLKGDGSGIISAAVAGTDYQAPLVSGTNIKTINNTTILGSGNISVTDEKVKQTPLGGTNSGRALLVSSNNGTSETTSGAYMSGNLQYNDYSAALTIYDTNKNKYGNYKYSSISLANSSHNYYGNINSNSSLTASASYTLPATSGTLALTSQIPTKTSDLTNDSGYTSNTGTVTGVTAGAGLNTTSNDTSTDGGTISSSGTLYLTKSGVTAGTYQGITVDKYGRVTSASDQGYITSAPVQSVNGQTGVVSLSIPTATSDLTNDSGFVTSSSLSSTYVPKTDGGVTFTKTGNLGYQQLAIKATSNGATADRQSRIILQGGDGQSEVESYVQISAGSNGSFTNTLTVDRTSTTIKNVVTPTADGDAANKKYVDDSIGALDGGTIGTGGTTKTITSLSQTNGNVSATFSNIAFPVTSVNTKTGAVVLTASDVGALSSSTNVVNDVQYNSVQKELRMNRNGSMSTIVTIDTLKTDLQVPTNTSSLTNDSGFITASDIPDVTKWNGVSLAKQSISYSDDAYVPSANSTSPSNMSFAKFTSTPTAKAIAKYDANSYLYSTTPSASDNSTKVATTAYVDTNTIANPSTKSSGQYLKYDGTDWIAADVTSGLSPLIGTTANITPTQVLAALQEGKAVYITHTDSTYGNLTATYFNYSASINVIASSIIFISTDDLRIGLTLVGDVAEDSWALSVVMIPQTAGDINAQPAIEAVGMLKNDLSNGVTAAVAGTDYLTPHNVATPTADGDAANKKYVDDAIAAAITAAITNSY